MSESTVLAIETSCDETAVAILRGKGQLLCSEVASQIELHRSYGGVVPEIASRNHLAKIEPILRSALAAIQLKELDCVSATRGPGLLTSLLVGYAAGKALAIGLNRPFIGVNHLEGHLLSPFFADVSGPVESIGLVVSGGHTMLIHLVEVGKYILVGQTRDDAAGEAFDKVAKLLGLSYPGGPIIERLAESGDPNRYEFPRGMLTSRDFDFSFSGLKTAVRYLLPSLRGDFEADLCASFQAAVVEVLVRKTIKAAKEFKVSLVTASGGVSCNQSLRKNLVHAASNAGLEVKLADPSLTTDNAAMIAFAALERYQRGMLGNIEDEADPSLKIY